MIDLSATNNVAARNRVLVIVDWIKAKMFGRDVSRE